MRRIVFLAVVFSLLLVPSWAITSEEIVKHFEESQNWVKSGMMAFKVLKKASDPRIADMFEFVSDKSYDYEALIIDSSEYQKNAGELKNLVGTLGNGVLAVIHKLATDEDKKLFKPTWLGYHTPADKKVSNWFCLIMGSHIKTYLTRVDQRSKLDEIGADPLQLNVMNKDLFNIEIAKDLGDKVILKVTPKAEANANFTEAGVEMAKLTVGDATTWYVTKISGAMNSGATGVTEFGNFRVAAAVPGEYIGWSEDNKPLGQVPTWGIATALQQKIKAGQKLFVFATQLKTTTQQNSKEIQDYEISLLTNIKRLHINPTTEAMAQYITPSRLNTLEKVTKKIVASH